MRSRALVALLVAAIVLAGCVLAGCSNEPDYSDQTIIGKVKAIEGDKVTLQLGEMQEGMLGLGQPGSQEPPAKPEGNAGQGEGNPPDLPAGQDGNPPDGPGAVPGGMSQSFTPSDKTASFDLKGAEFVQPASQGQLKADDILVLKIGTNNKVETVSIAGGGFGGSGAINQGTAATEITTDEDISGESYVSTGNDENALRVTGAKVNLKNVTVSKSAGSSSNVEDGDFYGMNAALLATDGAQLTMSDSDVSSSAQNGNGVFSYGNGTIVDISDCIITTSADNSGGIQTTGGATTNAKNLNVSTAGNSAAAIRSDRGGGIVNVDGGNYVSNGLNSPAVYSTADITVSNATLVANNSEAFVIEGKNSIKLENCNAMGNMSEKGSSADENRHNVMIYQSMSGDADVGTSEFDMSGGSLKALAGDMFYVTNTHAIMKLSGVEIDLSDDGRLLVVTGNTASKGWGSAGSNGAQLELTASAQTLEGSIVVDTISTLDLVLENDSSFSGTINVVENEQNGTPVADNANVVIGEGCTWTLTGDSYLTTLSDKGTINYNGYTITLADGTVLG